MAVYLRPPLFQHPTFLFYTTPTNNHHFSSVTSIQRAVLVGAYEMTQMAYHENKERLDSI